MKRSLLLLPLFFLACSQTPSESTEQQEPPTTSDSSSQNAMADPSLLRGKHMVTLKTSKGDITLELDADAAPKTVTNFVTHAKNGYYDKLTFHRVISDFMIQGGDPSGNGTGGESIWGEDFEDEMNAESYDLHTKKLADFFDGPIPSDVADWSLQQYYESQGYVYNSSLKSLPMKKGAIAMANRGPHTNGSQFFIIHGPETPWLEGKHTVFGMVTDGLDVVDAIAEVATDQQGMPNEPVTFSVEVQ